MNLGFDWLSGLRCLFNAHLNKLPVKFSVCVNEGQDTMYLLLKLHKTINSSSCTTTELSKLLTS